MPPASAHGSDIKTARPIEHHLIGISAVHQIFKKCVYQHRQIGHQKGAYAFGRFQSHEVAGGIEDDLLGVVFLQVVDSLSDRPIPIKSGAMHRPGEVMAGMMLRQR